MLDPALIHKRLKNKLKNQWSLTPLISMSFIGGKSDVESLRCRTAKKCQKQTFELVLQLSENMTDGDRLLGIFFTSRAIRNALSIILLGGIINATLANAEESGIIFSVRDYTNSGITYSSAGEHIKTLIEPIAFVKDGKLINPPENVDQQQFDKEYYSNHHKYKLYSGGEVGGSVEVLQSAFDIQCEGLAAVANVKPKGLVAGMRMALVSNANFKSIDYTRRDPTAAERAALLKAANELYVQNKIPKEIFNQAEVSIITTIEGKHSSILVGSLVAKEKTKEKDYDLYILHSVFVIMEKSGDESYKTTFTWFNSGSESYLETQDLVDVLDIDGDGYPEVITQFGYYEAVEYHVYRKTNGKWVDFYKNFGSGC